jgi:hypothetical protein
VQIHHLGEGSEGAIDTALHPLMVRLCRFTISARGTKFLKFLGQVGLSEIGWQGGARSDTELPRMSRLFRFTVRGARFVFLFAATRCCKNLICSHAGGQERRSSHAGRGRGRLLPSE